MHISEKLSLTMVRIPPSVGGEGSPHGVYLRWATTVEDIKHSEGKREQRVYKLK